MPDSTTTLADLRDLVRRFVEEREIGGSSIRPRT
jgi:hypothetical protein